MEPLSVRTFVRDVMKKEVITLKSSDRISDAYEKMNVHRIRHLHGQVTLTKK